MSNIFFGKTNVDCAVGIIEQLKKNFNLNKKAHHIVIVPDRISVLTEINIFNALNIESTCNIEVLTLSRLASRVAVDIDVISKTSSCMILQKLLKDNKKDLKCFNKKQDIDLANTLFETISQFKSCRIAVEDIFVNNSNKLLEDKLRDIALLYSKYQTYLKDKGLFDSLDRLDFVVEKIKENEEIVNSYVYICNFDSFTFQAMQLISGLIKNSREFNIGLTFTDSLVNGHIYNEDLKNNILKLFEINNIEPNIVICKENAVGQFKYIQDNLFAFNSYPLKVKDSAIKLFECKNFEEEVVVCASFIKDLIVNNSIKFSDVVVAVPNLSKKAEIIEKIFNKYNFSFFIDTSFNFKDSVLIRFVDSLINMVNENFSRVSVISFLKNPLSNFIQEEIEDFEDYLIKYNINDGYIIKSFNVENSKFYLNFNKVRNSLFESVEGFLTSLQQAKTFNDYVNTLEEVLIKFNVSQALSNFANKFTLENNIKQAKLFEQYYNDLLSIFDNVKNILGFEECDLKTFYSTFLSGVNVTKISTTPLSTNAIFVGDASVSFFDRTKIYFVLNADESNFPLTINDCGLVSDKEILQLSDSYKLEPTIASINFKERFKAFELLLKPTEKLFISYNYENKGTQKSKIISDISKLFVVENNKGGFNNLPFYIYEDIDFYIANNNYNTAKDNLISDLRSFYDGQKEEISDSLYKSVNEKEKINLNLFNYENIIKLNHNTFFSNNTVSVSQIESFMTCPFLHFVRYGLKLKEKDEGELNSLNIGNILHEVARLFMQNNNLPINKDLLEKEVELVFEKVINKDVFESVKKNASNKVLIKNLLLEAIRFCSVLNYQAKYSSFKTLATEARFDDKNLIKSFKIKINNKILKLVGQVDRIDKFEDYFRIIDYKTGKCDTSLKELFFGKKVQLEAYIKVVENSLKLKPAGAYYLPVKSSFADENISLEAKYQLNGRTLEIDKIINASDNRLENNELKSDIIEVKFNKNDNEIRTLSRYSKVINVKDMCNISEYAINLITKSCKDILTLNITPSPLVIGSDDPCTNCKYFALCNFDENFKNYKRNPNIKIDENSFNKGGVNNG